MARRKDGIETRQRILSAACEVFARSGYHNATVEQICTQAEANIAAVNYHFGSKEQLYAQTWRFAFEEAIRAYPPEGGLGPEAAAQERLRGSIHSLVAKLVDPGRIGCAGKLLLREMVSPTDVIAEVKKDALRPMHKRMTRLMRELLGEKASKEQVFLCQMSVVHQCIGVGVSVSTGRIPEDLRLDASSDELVEILAEHIYSFSMAGVDAVRKQVQACPA